MEDIITTKLSEIDQAMLMRYGVDVLSDKELEAQALTEAEYQLLTENN